MRLQALLDFDGAAQHVVYIGGPAALSTRRDRGGPRLDRAAGASERRADGRAGHIPGEVRTPVSRFADAVRRRPRLNILAFTLTVLIAVAALVVADLWWRRDRVLKAGEARATSLAVVLAEYIRGSFTSADAALRQLQIHGTRVGGPLAPRVEWESILASAKAALPESGSLSVTDASGIIVHSTQPTIVGQSARATTMSSSSSRRTTTDELVIDRPFRLPATASGADAPVRAPGRAPADQRRRTFRRDRSSRSSSPNGIRQFFQTIDVGPEGSISVLHLDGVVLFREPSATNPINEEAADHPIC